MTQAQELALTQLRDKNSSRATFRRASRIMTHCMAQQAIQFCELESIDIETPIAKTKGVRLKDHIVLIPILRSGMAMLQIFFQYFPDASVGVAGLKRDEKTAIAHWYYNNIPALDHHQVIVLDPMLATGGTGHDILKKLKSLGAQESKIMYISMVSAPEGVKRLKTEFPQVNLITAAQDDHLNEKEYIVPGLGDFGDRYFGTE
jgi:uracil phosphoribosyltransferase